MTGLTGSPRTSRGAIVGLYPANPLRARVRWACGCCSSDLESTRDEAISSSENRSGIGSFPC